jgi:hypothetical protein
MERAEERGGDQGASRMSHPFRNARRLILPYGLALMAVALDFLAGGAAGGGVLPLFWILHVLMGLTVAGWLLALVLAFRAERLRGLFAIPSALLIWATVAQYPLLIGGCVLGHECV